MHYTDNPERDMEFDQIELAEERKHKSLVERIAEEIEREEREDDNKRDYRRI